MEAKSSTKMYWKYNVPMKKDDLLNLPHKRDPMRIKWVIKHLPEFAKEMDGNAPENCLSFFYKKNNQTGVYEFLNEESEEEAAELMGVTIKQFMENDDIIESFDAMKTLSDEQMLTHKENLEMIHEGLKFMEK